MSSRLTTSPACIVANEPEIDINLARRLRGSGLPSQPVLEINPQHPLVRRLNREPADPHLAEWAHVLFDQAVLTLGARIEEPAAFVGRLNDLLVSLSADDSPVHAVRRHSWPSATCTCPTRGTGNGWRTCRPAQPGDWLLVAGDLAEKVEDIEWTLRTLRGRFGTVVWVPGNHDLWAHPRDPVKLRGEARYQHLVALCRELGVITPEDPYPVWTGDGGPAVIVPLFLLYDYTFRPDGTSTKAEALALAYRTGVIGADERHLHPDPYPSREAWCQARIDATLPRLAALDPELPTDPGQPLPAHPRAHPDPALPGVRAVVRHRADRRLAPALPRPHRGLRPPAHPADHVRGRRAVRGGVARLPLRAGPAPGAPAPAYPDPAARPGEDSRAATRRW